MNSRGSAKAVIDLYCISLFCWRIPTSQKARGRAVCKKKDHRVPGLVPFSSSSSSSLACCAPAAKRGKIKRKERKEYPVLAAELRFSAIHSNAHSRNPGEGIPIPTPAQTQGTASKLLSPLHSLLFIFPLLIIHSSLRLTYTSSPLLLPAIRISLYYRYNQHSLLRSPLSTPTDATTHNPRPIAGSSCLGCLNPTSLPHDLPEPRAKTSGQRSERASGFSCDPSDASSATRSGALGIPQKKKKKNKTKNI